MRHPLISLIALLAQGLLFASGAAAQPSFSEVTPPTDPYFDTPDTEDFWVNAVAPADIDADGDLDLAVLGFYVIYFESAEDQLVLFFNEGSDANGDWVFTRELIPLGSVTAGASDLAWGDYDRDGDPDLAVGSNGTTVLYRNDGGTLVAITNALPGYFEDSSYTGAYDLRSITWSDADNDGDLDLLVPSVFDFDTFTFATKLLRNEGPDGSGGWVFSDLVTTLDPTVHAQSAWADDDADGDLDLFLANVDPYTETGFIRRFRNNEGSFVGEDLLDVRVEYGLADWGDYDGDGDLDILVVGNIQESDGTFNTVLRVYRNQAGLYTENTLIDAPNADWLDLHAATWADYDSDGDVDLLVTGNFVGVSEIEGRSEIYGNQGGVFTALGVTLPAPISSIGRGGTFTWLDVDNDGDLDYFVAGAYFVPGGNGLVESQMHLYLNEAPAVNAVPSAPAEITVTAAGDAVTFSWDAAIDDQTPAEALTYDLDLRPSATLAATTTSQRLPEPGNVSAVTSWKLHGLEPGTYTWSVRAVDSAFNGSPAAEGTFVISSAPSDLKVRVIPPRDPLILPPEGGVIEYTVEIINQGTATRSFDLWIDRDEKRRPPFGGTPSSFTIPPGGLLLHAMSQPVPAAAAPGIYQQTVRVGSFPDVVEASDTLTWMKRRGPRR